MFHQEASVETIKLIYNIIFTFSNTLPFFLLIHIKIELVGKEILGQERNEHYTCDEQNYIFGVELGRTHGKC